MRVLAALAVTLGVLAGTGGLAGAADLQGVRAQIHKDGSGAWMRQHFPKDIEPIALTPGGTGTLVVLYSKTADLSIPFCTSYDIIMGVKKGKVTQGWKCGGDRCAD
jgi:hypothetical protein